MGGVVGAIHDGPFVDTHANGHARIGCGGNYSTDLLLVADVARVQANLGDAGVDGLESPVEVEMHIGNDRNRRGIHDLFESSGVGLCGHGDADQFRPGIGESADLLNRRVGIGGGGVGHALDDHRLAGTHDNIAHANLVCRDVSRLVRAQVFGVHDHVRDLRGAVEQRGELALGAACGEVFAGFAAGEHEHDAQR